MRGRRRRLVITQCSIRHLYTADPRVPDLVEQAKRFERRRCDHHTLDEPLSTLACLSSIVDAKGQGANKHRYVVATQLAEVRAHLRRIPGVPLIYINRSVIIMEPMATVTEDARDRDERRKFRSMLRDTAAGHRPSLKRTQDGELKEQTSEPQSGSGLPATPAETSPPPRPKKAKRRGPKGPNPLSVKKPKKRANGDHVPTRNDDGPLTHLAHGSSTALPRQSPAGPARKKPRRRRASSPSDGDPVEGSHLDTTNPPSRNLPS